MKNENRLKRIFLALVLFSNRFFLDVHYVFYTRKTFVEPNDSTLPLNPPQIIIVISKKQKTD